MSAGADFVVTGGQGGASELAGGRARLEQRPELLDAAAAIWAILNQVVDVYGPVVAGVERDLEQVDAGPRRPAHPAGRAPLRAPKGRHRTAEMGLAPALFSATM